MSDRKEYFKKYREDNKEHIKQYKKEYAKTHDSSFKKLQIKNKNLQQRIDKAIEYIKDKEVIINTDKIRIFDLFEISEQGYIDKLLSILKGEDK